MADEEQVAMLKRSVKEWNQWRQENPEVRPDLNHANLNEASLRSANPIGPDLNAGSRCQVLRRSIESRTYALQDA